MKTLGIIGGNGMLGSDLVKYLGLKFLVVPITKENYAQFIGKTFDVVINANGNSKRFWAIKNPLEDFTISTASVYKSIFDFKVTTYVYISSSDVYVNHSNSQFAIEDQYQDSTKLSSYGFHKYLSEEIIKNSCKNYIILRSSMILGQNLKKGPVFDILNKKPLFISKSSRLQMIRASEVASVITFLINKEIKHETFNIGGTGIVDFKKIQTYFTIPIKFSEGSETQVYEMNVSKLNKLFALKSSEEYLQEFINTLKQ